MEESSIKPKTDLSGEKRTGSSSSRDPSLYAAVGNEELRRRDKENSSSAPNDKDLMPKAAPAELLRDRNEERENPGSLGIGIAEERELLETEEEAEEED
jgi:hypothetical protein